MKLTRGKLILMGAALFSMHFGSSSMIWPMTWGKESGSSVFEAFLGIYLTALLFPLLGYVALSRGEGTFYQVSERISKSFAKWFCTITALVLGPLFVIPRVSAALWDALIQLFSCSPETIVPQLIFSASLYIIVYWFMSNKSDTINKISRFLLPVLLVFITLIIAKGLLFPVSSWQPKAFSVPAFVYGFNQGYATVELPTALFIATIVINDLKEKGISGKDLLKNLIFIGFIGISLLTVIHFCHMLLGSYTGNLFSDLKYSALYTRVVIELYGQTGGAIFIVTLLFAVLTSTIGLTSATAEYFYESSQGHISYKKATVVTLAISSVISTVGLNNIIIFTSPLLNMIYPSAISLTLYYSLVPQLTSDSKLMCSMRFSVKAAFGFGIFDAFIKYSSLLGIKSALLQSLYEIIPLSQYSLGWIPLTLLAGFVGYLISSYKSAGCNHNPLSLQYDSKQANE